MGLLTKFKDIVLRCDLFAANPTLRVRGEPAYENAICGVISLVLIGAFIGIFAGQVLSVLQKTHISASTNTADNPEESNSISNIRFAIGIENVDLRYVDPYFEFQLIRITKEKDMNDTIQHIRLEHCNKTVWKNYGADFDKYFHAFDMGNMLCPSPDDDISLEGYEGSDFFNKLELMVCRCTEPDPSSGLPNTCASSIDTDAYFNVHLDLYDFFKVRLFFVDTVISPSNDNPISLTLERDIFVTFTDSMGSRGEVTLGRYTIQTDQSILPFTIIEEDEGHYIQSFRTNAIDLRSTHFMIVQVTKSTLVYSVQRTHDKIDDLLSYIGGLFSLIFFVVFFFLGSFNQYRYELMVAESSFSFDRTGRKVKQTDMGICNYIKYSIYDWFKVIGVNLRWRQMQVIDEAKEEANEQMDIRLIMKKIRLFEKVSQMVVNDYLLGSLYLTKPMTIEQSRKNRKLIQYYDKIMENKFTQSEYSKVYDTLSLALQKAELPVEQERNKNRKETVHPELSQNQQINKVSELNFFESQQKVHNQTEKHKATKELDDNVFEKQDDEEQKPCCCAADEVYDSDDEEAEKYLYRMYKKLVNDQSPAAKDIIMSIPEYLKTRLHTKLQSQAKKSFLSFETSMQAKQQKQL